MSGNELEIICTDRNFLDRTVRYQVNNGNLFTPQEIIERLQNNTRIVVNMNGNRIHLEIQHFNDTETDENNRNIRSFIRNLPECPSEQ